MNKKIRWITETACFLALLIALQALTKPLGQLVTGSCVNTILAVAVLLAGISSGVTIALISPVLAFLLNIAPQLVTVPAIMVGNTVFVLLLRLIADPAGKSILRQVAAWLAAAVAKFAALYALVVWLICDVLAGSLKNAGMTVPAALPAMFSWPQLFTALIGGAVALVILPVLKRARHK